MFSLIEYWTAATQVDHLMLLFFCTLFKAQYFLMLFLELPPERELATI